jgi:hypothetical protein
MHICIILDDKFIKIINKKFVFDTNNMQYILLKEKVKLQTSKHVQSLMLKCMVHF